MYVQYISRVLNAGNTHFLQFQNSKYLRAAARRRFKHKWIDFVDSSSTNCLHSQIVIREHSDVDGQ